MSDQKQTYTVLSNLRHSGEEYERGDFVELTEEEADPLIHAGANPTVKEGEWRLGDERIDEPLEERNEPESKAKVEGSKEAKEIDEESGELIDDEEAASL